jgi:cell division protein FtsZ
MRTAEAGIAELHKVVDTLLIIPNQNLFRVANEKTTFADAFAMADQVLYSGVACITDLMVKEGLINLDFADVRAVMREMGKAMMGTGEAQGEKRALTAAEAAIANPLIDDSSMKGAKGLLISITGGKDLTLFEVDEAATRIREEVDQDANIIVGATFDESLDGIIRVSVVATGIDQAPGVRASQTSVPLTQIAQPVSAGSPPENRLADLTARLRADNARLAERAAKLEAAAQSAPQAAPVAAPAPRLPNPNVERAALAAIAAAVAPEPAPPTAPVQPAAYGDVMVRPIAQKPSLFPEPELGRAEVIEQVAPETFIPQAAERPPMRTPRMPKFEELPMPAQAEIRHARGEAEDDHPQKTRLSLLQRLANVGLGRRDDENEPPIAARASGPAMPAMPALPQPKPKRTVAEQISAHESPVSEYARRPVPQGLDTHGRSAPVAPAPQGDDHLDIPAFLRRQSN